MKNIDSQSEDLPTAVNYSDRSREKFAHIYMKKRARIYSINVKKPGKLAKFVFVVRNIIIIRIGKKNFTFFFSNVGCVVPPRLFLNEYTTPEEVLRVFFVRNEQKGWETMYRVILRNSKAFDMG